MGDPRRLGKQYDVPKRLWDSGRISEENALKEEFGLKNTREVWRAKTELRKIRHEARRLLSLGERGKAEAAKLIGRVLRLGFSSGDVTLDALLSLSVRDILDRRLQTRVTKLGLARTMRQARQLITHGYVAINSKKVSAPSYMVPVDQEKGIAHYRPIDLTPPAPQLKGKAKANASEAAPAAAPASAPEPAAKSE